VLIATDDERVIRAAASFGAQVVLTGRRHGTGTERVAEAAAGIEADVVLNVQGDEPLIDPGLIDGLAAVMEKEPAAAAASAAYRVSDPARAADPNLVKVVVDGSGNALYFSRSPVPYYRDAAAARSYLAHVGIYAYRKDFLIALAGMKETPLEAAEKLEQLRILENGRSVRIIETEYCHFGVDTPEDYRRFVEEWGVREKLADEAARQVPRQGKA
jgi:3-deoxy-manno-octulosonate cytidylyltransferase (CMP-KDO synthetase)